MRCGLIYKLILILLFLPFTVIPVDIAPFQQMPAEEPETSKARALELYGNLPMLFIENRGQLDESVSYYVKQGGRTIYFTGEGVVFNMVRTKEGEKTGETDREDVEQEMLVVSLEFVGANGTPLIAGGERDEAKVNYFTGGDRENWYTDIPTYREVVYREVYPGIDVRFYDGGGMLEYDFVVKPGAKVADIELAYSGVEGISLEDDELVVATAFGNMRQTEPHIYQQIADEEIEIDGTFRLCGETGYSLDIASYNTRYPLIIDPGLVYSTYLGGNFEDNGYGIAVDTAGSAYITGRTGSTNFPIQNQYQGDQPDTDAFVTKLNPSGNGLVYSTYLGGSGHDFGHGIAVDTTGSAYVTGYTDSADFPTQNQYQGDQPDTDTFVTKLSPSGNGLVYSTYLGGSNQDWGYGIAVDTAGSAYVTGYTDSTNFPTQGEYQGDQPDRDVFMTKIDTTKAGNDSLVYSTYLGGNDDDRGFGIAIGTGGLAYVTGRTDSTDFPTQNEYQGDQPNTDAFVTKIDTTKTGNDSLIYSTYLGGGDVDNGSGIAVDITGSAYITGETKSINFPTQNPYQVYQGVFDVFVTKLNTSGNGLVYSTYFGGSEYDAGYAIAVDIVSSAFITGFTYSSDFPMEDSYQDYRGNKDAHVFKLNTSGNGLVYSTYLGGSAEDTGHGIAVDTGGSAYITGHTFSDDFPKQNEYQGVQPDMDAFVTKLGAPDIAISPASVQFGQMTVGSSNGQALTVTNAGLGNLVVGNLTLTQGTGYFSLQNDACSGQTIAPGGSATVQVLCHPLSARLSSAVLTIPSNDLDEPTVTVALSGSAWEDSAAPTTSD